MESGTDVAILVLKALEHDARVLKESKTLADAGLDVVRVGIVTRSSDAEWERTAHDRILRVRTTDRLAAERPAAVSPSPSGGSSATGVRRWIGDLRHWLGRHKECRIAADEVARLEPEVVIACDLNTLPAGWRLKRQTGCRLVYDAHELFTEMSPPKSWLYKRLWRFTEKRLIGRADVVTTVSDQLASELSRRYGVSTPSVMLNGPVACTERTDRPVTEPVRILYQGNVTPARGIDVLVRAMSAVRGKAVLSIQGFGTDIPRLEELAARLELSDSVRFIPACLPDEVVGAAREHDVGVVILKARTLNDHLSAPNKLFDYLGAGIAVLGVDLPMMRQVIEREDCGVLFRPGDQEDLARALLRIASDVERLGVMKDNSAAACDRYSWAAQEQVLLDAVGHKEPSPERRTT